MKSIRLRLIVLFVIVTTLTLGIFGLYAQHLLSNELESRFGELIEGTKSRLQHNVPLPLWNYDLAILEQVVSAEMRQKEVVAIFVADKSNAIVMGSVRDADGHISPALSMAKVPGLAMEILLTEPSVKARPGFGKVILFVTRDYIEGALRAEISRRMLEVLVVDILLVLVLVLSLRMVFRPLGNLRDALFALAKQEDSAIEELPAPEAPEFGEVVDGFNQTQRKLRQVMARHIEAEATVVSAMDQLKRTQDELIKAEKLSGLGSLVAGIAHELNTPIGNGLVAVTTLEDKTAAFKREVAAEGLKKRSFEAFVSDVDATVDIAKRALERSGVLVSSFKQVAVDQSSSQRRKFALAEVIEETLVVLGPTLKKTPYKVDLTPIDHFILDSYPGSLVQVLTNLIHNAIVHGFDGRGHGVISIGARAPDAYTLDIRVADDGKGIEQANLGKIFDPFFTTKLGKGGSGLGLHIAHNSVSLVLGGKLNVTSTPGVGTVFIVTIPLVAPKVDKAEPGNIKA